VIRGLEVQDETDSTAAVYDGVPGTDGSATEDTDWGGHQALSISGKSLKNWVE
jgi:hypothetical protein